MLKPLILPLNANYSVKYVDIILANTSIVSTGESSSSATDHMSSFEVLPCTCLVPSFHNALWTNLITETTISIFGRFSSP